MLTEDISLEELKAVLKKLHQHKTAVEDKPNLQHFKYAGQSLLEDFCFCLTRYDLANPTLTTAKKQL